MNVVIGGVQGKNEGAKVILRSLGMGWTHAQMALRVSLPASTSTSSSLAEGESGGFEPLAGEAEVRDLAADGAMGRRR